MILRFESRNLARSFCDQLGRERIIVGSALRELPGRLRNLAALPKAGVESFGRCTAAMRTNRAARSAAQ